MAAPTINNLVEGSGTDEPFTIASYSPTVGANDKLVVLGSTEHGVNNTAITSITYAGNALTKAIDISAANSKNNCGIWYLDDPRSFATTGDVVLNATGADPNPAMKIFTLLGVASGAPEDTGTNTGTSTYAISTTVTPVSGERLITSIYSSDAVSGTAQTFDPTAPGAHSHIGAHLNVNSDHQTVGGESEHSGGDVTVTWDRTTGDRTLVSVCLAAAVWEPAVASGVSLLRYGSMRGVMRGALRGV